MGIFDDARKPSEMTAAGPSFPWHPPNLYQHLMELRANGRLMDADTSEMPDAAFIEKYGADAYWERTRNERGAGGGARGYDGGGVAEAMGGRAHVRLPEPAADYDENAPPESWHDAGAVNRARGESEAAKPRPDWSNPTLPTLDDIKAAGATRLEARNSPGFRALANRLQLSGEYDANGGMYGSTR